MSAAGLVSDRTVLNVVQLASARPANVSFPRFAASGVSYGILRGTVSDEVTGLHGAPQYRIKLYTNINSNLIAYPADVAFFRLFSVRAVGNEVLCKLS